MNRYLPRSRPLSTPALEAERLLSRYPDIGARELEDLIAIYPRLSMLDVAMMTADDDLSPKLAAFHEAHAHRLGASQNRAFAICLGLLILLAAAAAGVLL